MITSNIGAVKNILTLQELLVLLRKSSAISNVANGIYVESEITEVGKWLAAYAENKVEILSTIAAELEGFSQFQQDNDIQAPSFILYNSERITLRLVMWLPLQGTFDRSPFSYDEAHDHNFDFWTVNFTGSGYRTRLYNYDYEGVVGINGETVTLNCYGDKKLTQDTVMFYIRSKDVHTQYPPDELSASLNLIVKSVKAPHQYEFEIESDVLAGKTEATIKKGRFERYAFQRVLYNGLLKLDNETSRQLVNKVTYCNQCEEIRSIAYDALLNYLKIKGSNDDIRKIRDQVFKDPSSYVKNQIMYRIGSMLSA